MTRRAAGRGATLGALLLVATGCGEEVPHGGGARAPTPLVLQRIEPTHLLPGDLDLVVRIDLARLRTSLGPSALDAFAARLPGDALLASALARADSATIGLRADDLEAGDRVVVVEGRLDAIAAPDPARFAPGPSPAADVLLWDRNEAGIAPREQITRVVRVGDRALVFVTALEVDPTTRVLRSGPDEARGQPFAEGLISLDWRPRPLRASLAKRYKSIAGVLAGIVRVRATATMGEGAVLVRGEIEATDEGAAMKVARFLELLRDNAGEGGGALLGAAIVERAGASVHVALDVPAAVVLRAVSDETSR